MNKWVIALMVTCYLVMAFWPVHAKGKALNTFDEECLSLIDRGYYRYAKKYASAHRALSPAVLLEAKIRCALYNRERRQLRRILAHAPKSPMAFLARAVLAQKRNQLRLAERNCLLGLATKTARARVKRDLQLLLGQIYIDGYAYIAATEILFGDDNRDFNPYLILAKELGVRDSSHLRLAKAATKLDPRSIASWHEVMRGAIRVTDLDLAQKAFEKISALQQEQLTPQSSARGAIAVAEYGQSRSLNKWPAYSVLLLEMANLAWKMDESYEASWLAARAREEEESLPPLAKDLLGLLAYRMREYDRAWHYLSQQGIDTAFPGPYGHLAFLFGNKEEGLELLQNSSSEDGKLALANCYLKLNKYAKAKEELAKIAFHFASRYDYWICQAKVQLAMGQQKEAEKSLRQNIVLAKIGIVGRNQALLAADSCATLGFSHIAKELRLIDYDPTIYDRSKSRPYRLSGFSYRILADRAALEGEPNEALQLLQLAGLQLANAGLAAWSIRQQALCEPIVERLMDRVPNVRIQLPTVGGRVLLETGKADEALALISRGLNVDVAGTPGLFLMAATAQAARQDLPKMGIYTNVASVLGARRGAPWQELARLMGILGNEAAKNMTATNLKKSPHRRDRPDDRTAIWGMGELALEALTTPTISGSAGVLYGQGLAYAALGRDEMAMSALEKCLGQQSVWKSEAMSELFALALKLKKKVKAKELLSQLEKSRYGQIELLQAKYHLYSRDLEKAKPALNAALKKTPYRAEPHLLMAQIDLPNELIHLKRASELGPHLPLVWQQLTERHLKANDKKSALDCARKWLRAELQQGDFRESQKVVLKLLGMRKKLAKESVAQSAQCRAFSRLAPLLTPAKAVLAAREGALCALVDNDLVSVSHFCKLGSYYFEKASVAPNVTRAKVTKVSGPYLGLIFFLTVIGLPIAMSKALKRARHQT